MNGNGDGISLVAVLEALLFVADEPVEIADLARGLGVGAAETRALLGALAEALRGRGLQLQWQGARVQMVTVAAAGPHIERFLGGGSAQRLSTAALETLAIVAYKQPITRAGVEAIRGVDCGRALSTLRARDLVEEVGRAEAVGRPVLYGTTIRFLEYFGLQHPADLPPLPESGG